MSKDKERKLKNRFTYDENNGEYDFQFKFNGIYRKVSLQTIMEYGQGNL